MLTYITNECMPLEKMLARVQNLPDISASGQTWMRSPPLPGPSAPKGRPMPLSTSRSALRRWATPWSASCRRMFESHHLFRTRSPRRHTVSVNGARDAAMRKPPCGRRTKKEACQCLFTLTKRQPLLLPRHHHQWQRAGRTAGKGMRAGQARIRQLLAAGAAG